MSRRLISKFSDGGEYKRLEASTEVDALRIDDILTSRRVPGGISDRELFSGHCNGNQFADQPEIGDAKLREYAAYTGGKKPPTGAIYMEGLARHGMPGDPEAWVSSRDEAKRVLESRPGTVAQGIVRARAPEPIGPTHFRTKLDEKIVRKKMREAAEANPDLVRRPFDEVRAEIIEKHGNPFMKHEIEPIENCSSPPEMPPLPELIL